MQIHGAYTRGIQGHLFTVSAAPNAAGRLHVVGVRDTVAQHTATTVTHALKRLGIADVGADVRLEPAGAGDPPLATGRYSGTLDLPIALALLAVAGRLPADRLADVVAVGGLDPYAAIESAGVRCIGAGGTAAIAHAAEARGLRLIVAEDQAAAACAECRETTGAMTLEELVAVLAGDRDGEPLPHRTVAMKRRDPGTWRLSEGDLRALEIACAGWHNIHVIGPDSRSLPQYGRIAQARSRPQAHAAGDGVRLPGPGDPKRSPTAGCANGHLGPIGQLDSGAGADNPLRIRDAGQRQQPRFASGAAQRTDRMPGGQVAVPLDGAPGANQQRLAELEVPDAKTDLPARAVAGTAIQRRNASSDQIVAGVRRLQPDGGEWITDSDRADGKPSTGKGLDGGDE